MFLYFLNSLWSSSDGILNSAIFRGVLSDDWSLLSDNQVKLLIQPE